VLEPIPEQEEMNVVEIGDASRGNDVDFVTPFHHAVVIANAPSVKKNRRVRGEHCRLDMWKVLRPMGAIEQKVGENSLRFGLIPSSGSSIKNVS
jgi:hypothetical protein